MFQDAKVVEGVGIWDAVDGWDTRSYLRKKTVVYFFYVTINLILSPQAPTSSERPNVKMRKWLRGGRLRRVGV
jgi:hypothetical protein